MTVAPIRLSSDDLQQCIHCGMCLEACPTYRITGLETESPRGRIHLMDALAKGRIAPDDATVVHLDRCLACLACEAVCPSGVRYGRLIETTRAELRRSRPLGWWSRRVLRDVIGRPRVLGAAAAVASLYERLGIRALLRATGALRALPPRLARLERLYPPLTRPRYAKPRAPEPARARVALLLGCVMRVAYGDVHSATARVLARYGVEVVDAEGQACCGALHAHAGDHEGAVALARRNVEAFERAGVDAIVVDAAGCGAHLKGYGALLAHDARWAARGAAIAAKVRDVTEYLAATITDDTVGPLAMRVTYQDPCHLAHAQGIRREPRALLAKVAGLDVVEMREADVCCGSAGSYNVTQPEYADTLLARKLANVEAVAPQAVVTANPGCMLQLDAGLRAAGRRVEVLHVVEVLDRAMRA